MLLQMTQVCFYEYDYVVLQIVTENCAKTSHKLLKY